MDNEKDVSSEIYTTESEKGNSPRTDLQDLAKKMTTHSGVKFNILYSVAIQEFLKYVIDIAAFFSCPKDQAHIPIPRDKYRSCLIYCPVLVIQ